MFDYALYVASVLGAVALLLMAPRRGFNPWLLGAILGAATLGGLWLYLARRLPARLGLPSAAMVYYYVFSAIAIAAAARVITHTRPVYSALWFLLVVLAAAGLLLTLQAEFVAFAMVIIYAGAILVTYVFVIMLAAQAGDPGDPNPATEYDAVAREPVAAVAAGFLLLAMLLTLAFPSQFMQPGRGAAAASDAELTQGARPVLKPAPALSPPGVDGQGANRPASLTNTQRVGLDLFSSHPLGLELAGVILLVSLVGAVVIARRQVEAEHRLESPAEPPDAAELPARDPAPTEGSAPVA